MKILNMVYDVLVNLEFTLENGQKELGRVVLPINNESFSEDKFNALVQSVAKDVERLKKCTVVSVKTLSSKDLQLKNQQTKFAHFSNYKVYIKIMNEIAEYCYKISEKDLEEKARKVMAYLEGEDLDLSKGYFEKSLEEFIKLEEELNNKDVIEILKQFQSELNFLN